MSEKDWYEYSDYAKKMQPLSFGQKYVNLKTTDSGDVLSIKNFSAEIIDLIDISPCKSVIQTEDGHIERSKKDEAIKRVAEACLLAVSYLETKK